MNSPAEKRDSSDADQASQGQPGSTGTRADDHEPVDEALAELDSSQPEPADTGDNSASQRIAELEAALQEAQDRVLRLQADLENYRKRARREIEEERRFASLPLVRDLLPVIDNLNRAINAVRPDEPAAGLLEGVKMVEQQLQSVLQSHNYVAIEAEGAPFDPSWHEAIAEQPSSEHPQGTVLQVALPGYRLHDRVVRPSQVIVSKGAS